MISSMQKAIIKKDFLSVVTNRQLLPAFIVVPIVFTVFLPTLFILINHFSPGDMAELQTLLDMMPANRQGEALNRVFLSLILNYIMPIFFTIIPIMASSITAGSSFVGEKEKRTLETLLYSPLTLRKIFQSKVWASFLLSMAVSVASFIVMLITVETGVFLTTGSLLPPDVSWLVIMLLVSPAVSLLAITLIVRGSAKARTVEESQQRAVFLIMPLMLLVVGQFTGLILVSAWYLFGIGSVIAVISAVLMKRSMHKFTYEILLR